DSWWQWMFAPRSALAWYSGTWFEYVYLSTWRVLVGFAIASAVGISIGVLIGWFELMNDLLDPIVQALRPIPMTAWLPFATFIFGIREGAAIFLIAMGAFFPVVVSCTIGAEQTPKNLVRAALMLGTPPRGLLLRVVVPSALPYIFNGLRLGIGIADRAVDRGGVAKSLCGCSLVRLTGLRNHMLATPESDFEVAARIAHVEPLVGLDKKVQPAHTALLVIDMQNDGRDVSAAQKLAELLPDFIAAARR